MILGVYPPATFPGRRAELRSYPTPRSPTPPREPRMLYPRDAPKPLIVRTVAESDSPPDSTQLARSDLGSEAALMASLASSRRWVFGTSAVSRHPLGMRSCSSSNAERRSAMTPEDLRSWRTETGISQAKRSGSAR